MDNSYLLDKKIDYLIGMKVGKLQERLEIAMQQIDTMSSEISTLKNKVQRLNSGVSPQTTLNTGKKEVKKEENQRTGGLSPDDVSVEKMFYFGNK